MAESDIHCNVLQCRRPLSTESQACVTSCSRTIKEIQWRHRFVTVKSNRAIQIFCAGWLKTRSYT
ncbi:hypothetical protein RO3G_06125 [Rhizopus delemar RA 99-880]|uniref:Uncharacterized protein n=1 Tax=Rhizopus delemar (strain RA 99-880 / ATCC MYA-4621 / FGSC 9543 / NRRL 43880) TaxID=246409 RepID=I1BYZ0_RHIO9|nr:hypothetical protein RO3G_06125 [Rhizopus delemar RA 99-880]|eukprot:EIE81420.1 hypothetical protein RO3G_06125 [Rhizopus delemar RA 99-880]